MHKRKNNRKYYKNGYFDVWFLENSEFFKNKIKIEFFLLLEGAPSQPFASL